MTARRSEILSGGDFRRVGAIDGTADAETNRHGEWNTMIRPRRPSSSLASGNHPNSLLAAAMASLGSRLNSQNELQAGSGTLDVEQLNARSSSPMDVRHSPGTALLRAG